MHEVFLCRVAAHPILRKDLNFHVFLEYNQDVSIDQSSDQSLFLELLEKAENSEMTLFCNILIFQGSLK